MKKEVKVRLYLGQVTMHTGGCIGDYILKVFIYNGDLASFTLEDIISYKNDDRDRITL